MAVRSNKININVINIPEKNNLRLMFARVCVLGDNNVVISNIRN